MKKCLMIGMLLALPAITTVANDDDNAQQTLTVDSEQIEKTVSEIRFNGNNAVLLFTDGTTMEADMQQVSLQLSYNEATGMSQLHLGTANGHTTIYNLQGRPVAENQQLKGVYIINGKKINYQK